MGSPPTDKVLLKGVAAIVHDLVEFSPVRALFQTHLKGWRKKNALILDQRRKVAAEHAKYLQEAPEAADSDENEHWPVQTIWSLGRTNKKFVRIPTELNDKLEWCKKPRGFHFLRSLDNKQDFSTTESFVLLAELHDAAWPEAEDQIGYTEDQVHIVGLAEATNILAQGLSQVAVQNLETLVQRVLDLIEAQADSKSKNRTRKTLRQIIQRSREKLSDLVIRSRPQQTEPARTQSDGTLVSADQLGAFAGVGGKVIRVALNKAGCKPSLKSTGKGNPHQWRYCDAIQSLKAVKSGKLRSFIWPDSAAEVMPHKDSSKIPARKTSR